MLDQPSMYGIKFTFNNNFTVWQLVLVNKEMYLQRHQLPLRNYNFSCCSESQPESLQQFWTSIAYLISIIHNVLPRCMECRRGLAMRILSLCPSVKRVHCDKTEERFVQIFIPYERSFSFVFWEEEWLVEATPSTWNFGSTGPRWCEIADFEPIVARSASAVTPSEKVKLTLIGTPLGLRALQWA